MNTITETVVVTIPADPDATIITLPAGALPCRVCGIAVSDPRAHAAPTIIARRYGFDGRLIAEDEQAAVYCDTCAAVEAEVRPLMIRHLIAGPQVERVAGVLHALDALGGPAVTFADDDDLLALMEAIPAAASVGFAGGAKVGTCSARRFAHVDPILRRTLRENVARWMRARLETPVPIAPPADSDRRGCVFCGVGTVVAKPSESSRVWTETFVSASALGGGNGATGAIEGHTCPACTAAIASTDGAGVAALQAAVLAFVGYQRRSLTPPTVNGLRGWALVAGARPNAKPWQHVDLAGLRRSLASFEGGAS